MLMLFDSMSRLPILHEVLAMFENEALIIPLAGIVLPLVLVPMIMTMKFRMKKREWEHLERMRALQMGVAPAQAGHRIGPGVLISIGTGVPVASVLAAGITSLNVPSDLSDPLAVIAIAWGCAWLISTGAMVTAAVLGIVQARARKDASTLDEAAAKPAYEPDAYDVVSRRG
jgi:hypothetical protein